MTATSSKLLYRIVAGVCLILILFAIVNSSFRLGWFGSYDKIVIIGLGVLMIALVMFLPWEAERGSQSAERRQIAEHAGIRQRFRLNDALALLSAGGLLFFGTVPRYMRGESLSVSHWLILVLAVVLILWVARR